MAVANKSSDQYVVNSNDALELKLVRRSEDIHDDATSFQPEMTHQVFGDSETVFGYRDLKIKLYYSACGLTTYLGLSYSAKVDSDHFDGVEADDVLGEVSKWLQPGYLTNLDDFCTALSKDRTFIPFGELLHSFTFAARNGSKEKTFEIYYCDIKVPGFCSFHERLQTFLVWYIDAASYIDADDDKWKFFVLYERYRTNGETFHAVEGYATVYEYYAYPHNIRPRIGQILVLPPFQKQGLGCQLLNAIYQHYVPRSEVVDITVESPSEEFQRVRDYVDVKSCRELVLSEPAVLLGGYGKQVEKLFSALKLGKKQMRRVYEILRLQFTDVSNEEDYRRYRLEVKKRLNIPYQRELPDRKKLSKVLQPQELQTTVLLSSELRMETLEREFRELEGQYRHVLERLSLL